MVKNKVIRNKKKNHTNWHNEVSDLSEFNLSAQILFVRLRVSSTDSVNIKSIDSCIERDFLLLKPNNLFFFFFFWLGGWSGGEKTRIIMPKKSSTLS